MKLKSHLDLQIGKERFLGPRHDQFCNRYLRRADNIIEVQPIYRYGKTQKTVEMTINKFNQWVKENA